MTGVNSAGPYVVSDCDGQNGSWRVVDMHDHIVGQLESHTADLNSQIAKLRERAQTLRQLAKSITVEADAQTLLQLAAEMEADVIAMVLAEGLIPSVGGETDNPD